VAVQAESAAQEPELSAEAVPTAAAAAAAANLRSVQLAGSVQLAEAATEAGNIHVAFPIEQAFAAAEVPNQSELLAPFEALPFPAG
jgi:hypothetical protein